MSYCGNVFKSSLLILSSSNKKNYDIICRRVIMRFTGSMDFDGLVEFPGDGKVAKSTGIIQETLSTGH